MLIKPKISIVIPTYNCANFLLQAIESALDQTYVNTEIIIIDDGSTDETQELLKRYADNKKIIIFYQVNKGLSCARNKGIELSSGDYLTFLDSDDVLDKDFCDYLMNKCLKTDSDIVIANFAEFKKAEEIKTSTESSFNELIYPSFKSFLNDPKDYVARSTAWGKLYKRSIFKTVRFKPGVLHEDEHILLDVVLQSNKIFYTNKALYYYRNNINSITQSKITNKRRRDCFMAFYYRASRLLKLGFSADDYAMYYCQRLMRFLLDKKGWANPHSIKRTTCISKFALIMYKITKKRKILYLIATIFPFIYDLRNRTPNK